MNKNIKFEYLYRDAGNYKRHGKVIFSNPDGLSIIDVESALRLAMVQSELFIAHQIKIPEIFLYFELPLSDEDDHCFHEFSRCSLTNDVSTDYFNRSIVDFIEDVKISSRDGWVLFSPFERVIGF